MLFSLKGHGAFSLSDFTHLPHKVGWMFWKYCSKAQRKAFFLNRWCDKFRNTHSLMTLNAVPHSYPIPSAWLCPVLWDRPGAQASCKIFPPGNPFPLLLQTLTLSGKSNPRERLIPKKETCTSHSEFYLILGTCTRHTVLVLQLPDGHQVT